MKRTLSGLYKDIGMTDPVNPFNTNPNEPPAPQDPPNDTFVDQLNAIQNENGEPK